MENSGEMLRDRAAILDFSGSNASPEAMQPAHDHEKSLAFIMMCELSHLAIDY